MPRKQSLTELIRYEATRRPEIADLVDRAPTMTDEEIASCSVPMPWYRNALREIRLCARLDQGEIVYNPDPIGEMRQWSGIDVNFVKVDRDGELEIKERQYIWLDPKGGVWIGTAYSRQIDPRLLANSVSKGMVRKTAFMQAERDRMNGIHTDQMTVIYDDGPARPQTATNALSALGVRFFK